MKHGTASTYQNHGCRCLVCTQAKSWKMKQLAVAKKLKVETVNTLTSWWISVPREGLTKHVEANHQGRMSGSTLGYGRRPIGTEELNR